MTDYMADTRFCCQDCGHDTKLIRERYMVRESIWESAIWERGPATMLCVGCLEARLGRRLGHEDFINCPLNYGDGMIERHSQRLIHRLTRSNGLVDALTTHRAERNRLARIYYQQRKKAGEQ